MSLPFPYTNFSIKEENEKHWKVLCPFHKDTIPSLTINKNGRWVGYYRCWACNANGSPSKFATLTKQNPKLINFPKQEIEPIQETKVLWENYLELEKFNNAELSKQLGVSVAAIEKFGVRWVYDHWLIPMYNSKGQICGIQFRFKNGDKKAQKHSKQGIFKPTIKFDTNKPLYITEGFSDTAVMVEMGFQAIGKFNALHKLNKETTRQINKFSKVFIISDTDECGLKGSMELQKKVPNSLIIKPVHTTGTTHWYHKDIREQMLCCGKEYTRKFILDQLKS
jgi:hypothetical protein